MSMTLTHRIKDTNHNTRYIRADGTKLICLNIGDTIARKPPGKQHSRISP